MFAIYKKELQQFFSSIIGYIVIIVYLLINGIVLWVFPNSSIIENGYATLDEYFYRAPWMLIFLISAITMRMFSDEYKSGNMEILNTLPLKGIQIILGKFMASLTLIMTSILPTLIYIITISQLAYISNAVDYGGMIGSFIGLILLSAGFTAIGVFCSSLASNQIVSFLFSLLICSAFYTAFESISKLPVFENGVDYYLQHLGMSFHYFNINKGVLDSRDIVYFLSVSFLFLFFTNYTLESKKWDKLKNNNDENK